MLKILVGNKTDRDDREIPTAIGEEFAKQQGMYFLETSAKEADNVERLFYEIAAELIEQARTKEVILLQLNRTSCAHGFEWLQIVTIVPNRTANSTERNGRHIEFRNQSEFTQSDH